MTYIKSGVSVFQQWRIQHRGAVVCALSVAALVLTGMTPANCDAGNQTCSQDPTVTSPGLVQKHQFKESQSPEDSEIPADAPLEQDEYGRPLQAEDGLLEQDEFQSPEDSEIPADDPLEQDESLTQSNEEDSEIPADEPLEQDESLTQSNESALAVHLKCFGTSPSCGYYWYSRCPHGWTKCNYNNGGSQTCAGQRVNCGSGCWSGWKLLCQKHVPTGCRWIGKAPACEAHYSDCFAIRKAYHGEASRENHACNQHFGHSCNSGVKVLCKDPVFTKFGKAGTVTDGSKFKLAFWNIFSRPFVAAHDGQYERQMNVPFKINDFAHGQLDAIVLDEAWMLYQEFSDLLDDVGFTYRCFDGAKANKEKQSTTEPTGGVLIASKHQITDCEYKKFYEGNVLIGKDSLTGWGPKNPMCSGADCMVSKGMLFARIQKDSSHSYNVFGTHMNANYNHSEDNPTYGKYHAVRKLQAVVARKFIQGLQSSGRIQSGPILVAGDLNSDWYHHQAETKEVLNLMGMDPTIPSPLQCTYCLKGDNDLVKIDYPVLQRAEFLDYIGVYDNGVLPKTRTSKVISGSGIRFPTPFWSSPSLEVCTGIKKSASKSWKAKIINGALEKTAGYEHHNGALCGRTHRTRDLSDHKPVVASYDFTGVDFSPCKDTIPHCDVHKRNGGCLAANPHHHAWRTACVKTCAYCADSRYNKR